MEGIHNIYNRYYFPIVEIKIHVFHNNNIMTPGGCFSFEIHIMYLVENVFIILFYYRLACNWTTQGNENLKHLSKVYFLHLCDARFVTKTCIVK